MEIDRKEQATWLIQGYGMIEGMIASKSVEVVQPSCLATDMHTYLYLNECKIT
jgi:hypothetical protein